MEDFVRHYLWLIPALPLLGFVLNGLPTAFGVKLPKPYVNFVACGAMLGAFCMAVCTFLALRNLPVDARQIHLTLWPWIHVGTTSVDIAFLADPLSAVMMLIITGIGFLIHVYSTGYMSEEPSYARFLTYLNLFCFMMLLLVMGDNLLLLFVGWEGVGLASYLLIGFWHQHKANGAAGMKAFIVNRVGDFGLMIGLMGLFWALNSVGKGTLNYADLKLAVGSLQGMTILGTSAATIICLCLFVGATGKSAQIPLYVWLPDAMAGPTPVSALIHAATMVTAGVYMIARLNWLFAMSPVALTVIATVGAATALFAATIGFAQTDIKKVLAYSTVSQLGYMFLAMGSGAYVAGVFHLMTHAFFKACLFLGSGSVIHGMHHEQDMRLMGGLRKYMPVTFATFLAATIAIAGVFPFSGFFSKDEILWQAFEHGQHNSWYYVLWAVGLLAAMGTSFYMMRAVTLTFFGDLRANDPAAQKLVHGDHHSDHAHDDHGHGHYELHPHESPVSMTFGLVVLAILSVFGGFLNVPYSIAHLFGGEGNLFTSWLAPIIPMHEHHEVEAIEYVLMVGSVALAVGFLSLGYVLFSKHKNRVEAFVAAWPKLYRAVYNKYYIDEFYQAVFVRGLLKIDAICASFDRNVVDGLVNLVGRATEIYARVTAWVDRFFVDGAVNGVAALCSAGGAQARRLQTGKIQHYAFVAVIGVVVVLVIKMMF